MVSSAFNPLYAAAAMYQQRERRASAMQPYYQQHVQMDYGNRVQGALAYGSLFSASGAGAGPDPFLPSNDVNMCQPTALYGYGQPQQQHLATSPFSTSPNPVGVFKCEPPFQQHTSILDGSSDIRSGRNSAKDDACGLQSANAISNAIGGIKGASFPAAAGQQPSAAAIPPCSSFTPCRMFPPTGREAEMEADARTSPSAYFYGTGRPTNAQSCYAMTPPSTGFYFPGTNLTQQAVSFGSSQFGESGQMVPFAQDYPWMKNKLQTGQTSYASNLAVPADSAMEIGRWCSPNASRTRTREKYRMVYTDGQRLELEKEFITSEYISTQRKAYLSRALGLSERQIKIWFQNRRAKKRKQARKTNVVGDGSAVVIQSHLRPIVSSTSDFRALASISASEEGDVSRRHSLENLSSSPDPFL